MSEDPQANIVLNKDAKVYVPKPKQAEVKSETLNTDILDKLNLDAVEFKPKKIEEQPNQMIISSLEDELEEDEDDDDDIDNIDDLIKKEGIDFQHEEDEESDEEKWFPKYQECSCCKGFIYKCEGEVCKSLGVCFCKAQEEYDPEV